MQSPITELQPAPPWTDNPADPLAAIGQPGVTLVFLTETDCAPCRFMKPVVRKFALDTEGAVQVVELDGATSVAFCRQFEVRRFPEVLLFRGGALLTRKIGFHGARETLDWLHEAVRTALEDDETGAARSLALTTRRPDLEAPFLLAFQQAETALEAEMAPFNAALAPHVTAAAPQMGALQTRIAEGLAAGTLTKAEAGAWQRDEIARIYAPFQDKIDAHRAAMEVGFARFDALAAAGLQALAEAAPARGRLVCSPDGTICEYVPDGSASGIDTDQVSR